MIAISLVATNNVLVATFVYRLQLKQAYPGIAPPHVRVSTFVKSTGSFFVILHLTGKDWMQRAELDGELWYASHHPDRLMTPPAGTGPAAQYSRNKARSAHKMG